MGLNLLELCALLTVLSLCWAFCSLFFVRLFYVFFFSIRGHCCSDVFFIFSVMLRSNGGWRHLRYGKWSAMTLAPYSRHHSCARTTLESIIALYAQSGEIFHWWQLAVPWCLRQIIDDWWWRDMVPYCTGQSMATPGDFGSWRKTTVTP